jgi:hypothetical protein
MYIPRIIDFYKALGERKLPPYPFKQLPIYKLVYSNTDQIKTMQP